MMLRSTKSTKLMFIKRALYYDIINVLSDLFVEPWIDIESFDGFIVRKYEKAESRSDIEYYFY